MRKTSEATTVAPHPCFNLLSKKVQLQQNPQITEHLQCFYTKNNMHSLLTTLVEAHSSLLEVHSTKLSKKLDEDIHVLINFVSVLTHHHLKTV